MIGMYGIREKSIFCFKKGNELGGGGIHPEFQCLKDRSRGLSAGHSQPSLFSESQSNGVGRMTPETVLCPVQTCAYTPAHTCVLHTYTHTHTHAHTQNTMHQ